MAKAKWEYGFYDSEYGPNPIIWFAFLSLPFTSRAMAKHTADKSVWGQAVIVRRPAGTTDLSVWEHADPQPTSLGSNDG